MIESLFKNLSFLFFQIVSKDMPALQFLGYSTLVVVALYLGYVVSTTLIGLLWYLAKTVIFGTLLAIIVWFLYRQGFFEFLKQKFK
jgi:hypothetical protein